MDKTIAFSGVVMGVGVILAVASPIASAADDELDSVEDLTFVPEVFLVSNQRKSDCARVPGICLFADGGGTVAGVDEDSTLGAVTALARGTQVAGLAKGEKVPEAKAWHVELVARFRTRTVDAPIVVAVLDRADPEGIARKEATAVWQLASPPTKDLGMRLAFSADDGFQSHHTYLVRIVQGTGANEKALAEGNVLLE
jgi:hypothetical protein